jgi:hypothetical protein
MNVLAIDPGKESGWAEWYNGQFSSAMMPHNTLLDLAWTDMHNYDMVAVESYIITAATLKKTRGDNWSLEQIGALRWMAHRHNVKFVLQSPADAKSFVKNDRLAGLGWYKTGPGHDNDAARHLLLALANHDSRTFRELVT